MEHLVKVDRPLVDRLSAYGNGYAQPGSLTDIQTEFAYRPMKVMKTSRTENKMLAHICSRC